LVGTTVRIRPLATFEAETGLVSGVRSFRDTVRELFEK
jgi:hypothetical protein